MKNKRGVSYVAAILLTLIAIAIAGMIYGFLIQNVSRLGNIASKCGSDSYLKIEDGCYLEDEKYNLLYLYLYRPITNEQEQTSFIVKFYLDGASKIVYFNNLTFYEYKNGNINKTKGKLESGEGRSFIILLDPYEINGSEIKEISVNAIFKDGKQEFSCGFIENFKIKECKNLDIRNIENLESYQMQVQDGTNRISIIPTYNLPW